MDDQSKNERWTTVQYWPKSKPIPDGWAHDVGALEGTHHGYYSILIVKIDSNAMEDE